VARTDANTLNASAPLILRPLICGFSNRRTRADWVTGVVAQRSVPLSQAVTRPWWACLSCSNAESVDPRESSIDSAVLGPRPP
jgi:hypothetical protein